MRIPWTVVVALLLGVFGEPGFAADKPAPIRVLFIGNSYTSVNDLPGMLEALSASAKAERPIETARSTRGGWTLQRHWDDEKSTARELINTGKWDYVVLQEQSQMPFMYPKVTHKYGVELCKLIESRGAKPLLYMTWAREHQPENQAKIRQTYEGIAKERKAAIAPVGLAWEAVLKQSGKIKLHQKDRSHPTAEGTYLAACVFFATIYERSPEGLNGSLVTKQGNRSRVISRIDTAKARVLQRSAWQVAKPDKAKPSSN